LERFDRCTARQQLKVPDQHRHCHLQLEESKPHAQASPWALAKSLEGMRRPLRLLFWSPLIRVEGVRVRPLIWILVKGLVWEENHIILPDSEVSPWQAIVFVASSHCQCCRTVQSQCLHHRHFKVGKSLQAGIVGKDPVGNFPSLVHLDFLLCRSRQ